MALKKVVRRPSIENSGSLLSRFLTSIKESIFANLVSPLEDKIKSTERKVVRCITSYFFFFLGIISLGVFLILALEYYFNLKVLWGFFIYGFLLLFISLILRISAKRGN